MPTTMKHVMSISLLTAFLFFPSGAGASECGNPSCDDGNPVIVIIPVRTQNPGPPILRSPAFVPIQATYSFSTDSVSITFSEDVGLVALTVQNLSTGDILENVLDSACGGTRIPVLCGSGYYLITFTLFSEQQYQGEFES